MQDKVIKTRQDYDAFKALGYEPLRDTHFSMNHSLRVEIQKEIFGVGNKEENNIRFYRYAWKVANPKNCENCGVPLERYSSVHISHILSRGAHPNMAYDLRNFNLLCYRCHEQWESPLTREGMRIYTKNQRIIEKLRKEYDGI